MINLSRLLKLYLFLICPLLVFAQKIDREALVNRHKVLVKSLDTLSSLTVGNGSFAFTVDATGLQTFPDYYANGIPLGTQSEWSWHSFPNKENYSIEEGFKEMNSHGRKVIYTPQFSEPQRKKDAINFLRQNPHRVHLGNIGFELYKKDGTKAQINDISQVDQTLNLWTGEIISHFVFDGQPVNVKTVSHQQKDVIGVSVESPLLKTGQLMVRIRIPYPTDKFLDNGNNWANADKHSSIVTKQGEKRVAIQHKIDNLNYAIAFASDQNIKSQIRQSHYFIIQPSIQTDKWSFTCDFAEKAPSTIPLTFAAIETNSQQGWNKFWNSGGAIDFSGSTDTRANELERRIILSQYLTKVQGTTNTPPQETGLTYNSWFGKPHLEMHWWHSVHFALWGRIDLLEKSLDWYRIALPTAKKIAQRQGFRGARWQKMTDNKGGETGSSVGAYLIWQQPHIITFAELCYREKPTKQTLEKYKELIFETAHFMASYAYFDKQKGKYILGKGLIPAQERFKPEETFNPTYEINYWYWALNAAQNWRKRLGLQPDKSWQEVIDKLSPLPVKDEVYLATESSPDSYTNPLYLTDHPSVLATFGMLPETPMLDTKIMKNTFEKVWKVWHWDDTWGWDFPMVAMSATRLDMPEYAIDGLLMNIRTNTYLNNGHNFQDQRLRLYMPGNGGLLTAVALMCAGYDDCKITNPGFPKDGSWKVQWEGLKKFF
ncbi:hypothetical protein [Emticicia sp. C21]|uniref:hypothetical protein n=1 Tax=Emticicia sp. C21 TaxID=2302915 RepID=UPI000E3549B5|nr:hypothetical protein [Emticicia sp. C21]RFS14784.1 hypothetical protein D0T08_19170 [Emticicia sp. C21]